MNVISPRALHTAGTNAAPTPARSFVELAPPLIAAAYPFFLQGFHAAMEGPESGLTFSHIIGASAFMALAFAVAAVGLLFAYRTAGIARPTAFQMRARRLAYLTVGAPPLYVLFGVLDTYIGLPVSPEGLWAVIWLAVVLWAAASRGSPAQAPKAAAPLGSKTLGRLRAGHGIVAATILIFILFHLTNHLFAWGGQEAHTAVMDAGRAVYRMPVVETIIVVLFLLQVIGGLTLAWRWSAQPADSYRVFQIASGVYLACFILCHMNSIFVGARLIWDIPTDWAFMTSQPTGLLHSAGSLIPHYTLGVFFVLGHLLSGARHVALTHGFNRPLVNRVWGVGLAVSLILAAVIMSGLCGARI